jgi:predicted MFS family arabinose efflux permease
MNERDLKRPILLFMISSIALLTTAIGFMSYRSVAHYEARLLPEIEDKARTVGTELDRRIAQALDFSGLAQVRGVPQFFDKALEKNPELAYLALLRPDDTLVTERMAAGSVGYSNRANDSSVVDMTLPITVDDAILGTLHLGISSHYSRHILLELVYDVLTILVVSLLMTFGLLSFVIQTSVSERITSMLGMLNRIGQGDFRACRKNAASDRIGRMLDRVDDHLESVRRLYRDTMANLEAMGPIAGEERRVLLRIGQRNHLSDPPIDDTSAMTRLVTMRVMVFVFFVAEEMTRPFLPLYITEVAGNSAGASTIVSLPLSLFMLVAALAQPLGGMWVDRLGRRRLFLISAFTSVAGLALTAAATAYWELLFSRSLCAAGYGIVFVTCQGYAVDNTTPKTRARGIAMFVGGIMAAALCGPSIGGMVADHFGFRPALLIAAGISLGAAAIGQSVMQDTETRPVAAQRFALRHLGTIVTNRRLLALTLLVAIPAKIVLSAVLFYLTPIYLTALGEPQSVVGRVLMVYGGATVLFGPLIARFADTYWRQRHWFVGIGAMISGCGFLPILWMPGNFWVLVIGIATLGIGQALCMSPQLALVPEIAARECQEVGATIVLGMFRLVERAGGSLGPLAAGVLADWVGNGGAIAWIGQIVLGAGLTFLVLMLTVHQRHTT